MLTDSLIIVGQEFCNRRRPNLASNSIRLHVLVTKNVLIINIGECISGLLGKFGLETADETSHPKLMMGIRLLCGGVSRLRLE